MRERVVVYFDYLCPYAWRGAEVAAMVGDRLGMSFAWRHFSVVQAAYAPAPGWQLWDAPLDDTDPLGSRGLLPFLAGCAARRQGAEAADAFRLGLLRARHRDGRPLSRRTSLEVAERVGLRLARFESDLEDPELRTCLAQEHHQAAARSVVGTPTFAFEGGDLAALRVREVPRDADEAVRLFRDFRGLLARYPYLEGFDRPRPPRN